MRPALRKLSGHSEPFRPRVTVVLEEGFTRHPGREEYVRATITTSDSELTALPTGMQGSGMLTSMIGANALLVLPAESERFNKGDRVSALLTGPLIPPPERVA